jgi:hypothetical protein
VVAASLAAGCIALAFYMDWLGLWVSEQELREKREQAKERMRLFRAEALGLHPAADAGAGTAPGAVASGRAFAFDVDAASLGSLREALPGWEFEAVNGATAASLGCDWGTQLVGLLVVGLREKVAGSLGPCRFLAHRVSSAGYPRPGKAGAGKGRPGPLLIVLTPSGQESLLEGLECSHRCLGLPLQPTEVARLLGHATAGDGTGPMDGVFSPR